MTLWGELAGLHKGKKPTKADRLAAVLLKLGKKPEDLMPKKGTLPKLKGALPQNKPTGDIKLV
jgi:hypothetical protein